MVAIVSGNSLGLELTSLGTLGSQGLWGSASQGNNGEQVYVNAATGNLVVQRRDEFLASHGLDNQAVRTYNSLGQLTSDGDNNDNWSLGVYAQQLLLSGTVNTVGSTLTRTGRDGSQSTYAWNASRSCYVTTAGSGAHDTIVYSAGAYSRTDGSSREVEKYTATGLNNALRLVSVTDADGNSSTYSYHTESGLLASVIDKSNESVTYTYNNVGTGISNGTKLLSIVTKDASGTVTRNSVTYTYDTSNRLSTVTVDLTPEDKSNTDGKVYKTSYTYDGTSTRIKTLTQDDGSSLTFTYDASNRVASITDMLGSVTSYAYDTAARRTTVTDPMGKVWLYDYDATGQLTRLTSPAIGSTSIAQSYAYDASGNVTSITNGDGETVTMIYDANGNQTRVTDALGNTMVRTYSAANQLLTETTSNAGTPPMVDQGDISIIGSDIVKTGGINDWNSSFRSSDGLVGGASVSFKPAQTDKALMVGLNSDPGGSHDWDTLDFAIYCTSTGTLHVRESGSGNLLTSTVTYAAGDDLRVTYDGTKVSYLKNGTVFWTTTVTTSQKLYADSSFYHVGGKITNLSFGATATTGTAALVAQSNATVSSGGTVVKTNGVNGSWDASVRGLTGYVGNAMVSFKPAQTNLSFMVGLNTDPSSSDSYGSLDYAYYCTGSGELRAYESGVSVDLNATYTANDTLKIVYAAGKIQYLKINSAGTTVMREVTVNITQALYLDSTFCSSNVKVTDLQFGKTGLGTVMAVAPESGMTINGDTLKKTGGTSGAWDSAVRSSVGYTGQAYLSFSPAQADKGFMVGLNSDPDSTYGWSSLDYAFYCTSTGALEIREAGSGNVLTTAASYTAGDKLEILYDGSAIRYLKNGAELRSVTVAITDPLYVDSSFYHVGAQVTDLRFGDRAKPELTTRYVYSATKPTQLRYSISAEGRVTQYQYNSYGELSAQITYPRKLYTVTTLASDFVPTETQLNDWVTAIGDLSNTVRKDFAYDARGLLAYLYEYEGATSTGVGTAQHYTHYVYDQGGRLLQTIQMGGTSGDEVGSSTTTYTYDGLGRMLTVTDPHGALTSTVYTDTAQKAVVTSQSGAVATSVYDKAGRLISLARSGDGTTTYAYDVAGRLLMTTDPTGVKKFNVYDDLGRQVGSVDGDGTLTETIYDKAGRVIRVYTYATAVDLGLLRDGTGAALNPTLTDIRPSGSAGGVQFWNVYNDAGQLVYEIADSGAVTQYDYDGAGLRVRTLRYAATIITATSPTLTSVRAQLDDPAITASVDNRSERFIYDADGLLRATIDAEGYFTRISYDNAGRKIQTRRFADPVPDNERAGGGTVEAVTPLVDSVNDQVDTFYYDARGLLIAQVDAGRYLSYNTYDNRGLLSSQTRYAKALAITPSWGANVADLVAEVSPGGIGTVGDDDRQSLWYYTLDGQVLKSVNFEGLTTFNDYDNAGRLIKSTVGYGRTDKRVSEFRYDAWGRKTAELGGEGAAKVTTGMTQTQIDAVWTSDAVEYDYNSAGLLSNVTDANGYKTLYYYDDDGRVTLTIDATGSATEAKYNTLGQLVSTTKFSTPIATGGRLGGRLATSAVATDLATITAAGGNSTVKFSYNGAGQLYSTTDPAGAITYNSYNSFGELSEQKIAWQSGANLNVDPRIEQFSHDKRGLLLSAVRDVGGIEATTSTEYDAFGRVTKSTNANGKSQTFAYDKLGRLVTTTDPLTKSVTTTYDAFGQVLTVKDQVGQTTGKITSYSYDRAARSVTMTTPEGVTIVTTRNAYGETYAVKVGDNVNSYCYYDRDGNLTQTKVGATVTGTREYDAGDRLVSSTDANGVQTTYTYDAANRVVTRTVEPTDTSDTDTELNLQTKWEYDAKGQAVKVTDPRGVVTEYTFDLDGRTIKQVVDPTGLAQATNWTYDAEGRALTVVDPNGATTQYVYDTLGRRTSETVDAGTGKLNLKRSYTYDDAGNVLSATDARGKVTRYRYDDAGRLSYTADPAGSVTRTEYNAKGQLTLADALRRHRHQQRGAQRCGWRQCPRPDHPLLLRQRRAAGVHRRCGWCGHQEHLRRPRQHRRGHALRGPGHQHRKRHRGGSQRRAGPRHPHRVRRVQPRDLSGRLDGQRYAQRVRPQRQRDPPHVVLHHCRVHRGPQHRSAQRHLRPRRALHLRRREPPRLLIHRHRRRHPQQL
jgi:YD repeat-containing protein